LVSDLIYLRVGFDLLFTAFGNKKLMRLFSKDSVQNYPMPIF